MAEMRALDWQSLAADAPDEPGLWPIDALTTRRDEVDVVPSFYVPYDGGDPCVIVDASGSSSIRRIVIDGFALRDGLTPETMSNAEWAALNF